MNYTNKEIGTRIFKLREKLNFSREKLGESAGISDRFLYDIEMGNKGMSAETLFKISNALGVTSDYLLTGKIQNENMTSIIGLLSKLNKNDFKYAEKILRNFYYALSQKHNL